MTPHSVALDLGLHCLSMSHKKDARLIWIKMILNMFCTNLAAITGIHGVNSSLWLPISQSESGNKLSFDGVIADSFK